MAEMTVEQMKAEMERLKGLLKAKKAVEATVELVTDSAKYPNVYLSVDNKWIGLNKGTSLDASGRAKLARIQASIVGLSENVRDAKKVSSVG